MTDKEIKKALEDWIKYYDGDCSYAHFKTLENALDLINRQKTEIDENTMLRATLKTAKVEAYKEFAELLQNICIEQQGCLYSSDIGAVYNELTGEQND